MPGQLSLNFCASIHDLGDAGLAIMPPRRLPNPGHSSWRNRAPMHDHLPMR
jgi:hypothetical protein